MPISAAARSAPDGYSLLLYSNPLWTAPLLQTVPYDTFADFTPISFAYRATNILVIHPAVPATTVEELITLAKSRPGQLNYGSGSTGSTNHLAVELLKLNAGIDIVRVPYKGVGPFIRGLLGNEVQVAFASWSSISAHVKAGKMRALAVASLQPSPLVPGVRTIASAGLPGFESEVITGLFAPAKTPKEVVDLIHGEVSRLLAKPDTKQLFLQSGSEVVGSPGAELSIAIREDVKRMERVIKAAGIVMEQ